MRNRLLLASALAALVSTGTSAATVGFTNIAGGSTVGDSLVGKFSMDITTFSATQILVKVISAANAGATYFIGGVFIDDDPAFALGKETNAFSSMYSTNLNSFKYKSNGNLPQLTNFGETSSYLKAKDDCQANVCGIQ